MAPLHRSSTAPATWEEEEEEDNADDDDDDRDARVELGGRPCLLVGGLVAAGLVSLLMAEAVAETVAVAVATDTGTAAVVMGTPAATAAAAAAAAAASSAAFFSAAILRRMQSFSGATALHTTVSSSESADEMEPGDAALARSTSVGALVGDVVDDVGLLGVDVVAPGVAIADDGDDAKYTPSAAATSGDDAPRALRVSEMWAASAENSPTLAHALAVRLAPAPWPQPQSKSSLPSSSRGDEASRLGGRPSEGDDGGDDSAKQFASSPAMHDSDSDPGPDTDEVADADADVAGELAEDVSVMIAGISAASTSCVTAAHAAAALFASAAVADRVCLQRPGDDES